MAVRQPVPRQRQMQLIELAHVMMDAAGREPRGLEMRGVAGRHVPEARLRQLQQHALVHLARGGEHEIGGAVLRLRPVAQIGGGDRRDARLGAQHGAAERLVGPRREREVIEHDVVGRIARLTQFGKDDLLLALQLVAVEPRIAHQIGDQIDAQRQIVGQQPRVEHGMVARGPRIQAAADILDIFRNRLGAARAGALEHHMLDHVRHAVQRRRLRSRARHSRRARPPASRRRASARTLR